MGNCWLEAAVLFPPQPPSMAWQQWQSPQQSQRPATWLQKQQPQPVNPTNITRAASDMNKRRMGFFPFVHLLIRVGSSVELSLLLQFPRSLRGKPGEPGYVRATIATCLNIFVPGTQAA